MHDSKIELNEQVNNSFLERHLKPKHLYEKPYNINKILKDNIITSIKSIKSS